MRRFERYVDALSDDEVLFLHKIVSRRASALYEQRFRARWRAGMEGARRVPRPVSHRGD